MQLLYVFTLNGKKISKHWLSAALFASCWTLGELARAEFFTGFPWGAIGYAPYYDSVLVSLAPWVGVYGIGWVAAYISALMAEYVLLFKNNHTLHGGLILASLGIALLAVPWKVNLTSSRSVVQCEPIARQYSTRIEIHPSQRESLKWYVDNAVSAKTDLVGHA
jgi:apolipoprotein N-acyltransferase